MEGVFGHGVLAFVGASSLEASKTVIVSVSLSLTVPSDCSAEYPKTMLQVGQHSAMSDFR